MNNWVEVGIQTAEEIKRAVARGYLKCHNCFVYKPIMTGSVCCFSCETNYRLGRDI